MYLVQDNNDANLYYIGVYDNNYPGETRYINMKCNFAFCKTIKNDSYSGSTSISISKSVDEVLSFYK